MRIRRIPKTYSKGKDLLVIENIPVISCPHCGSSHLTAETLHEIDRIRRKRKTLLALVDNPEIYFKSAREFKQALSRGGILEL